MDAINRASDQRLPIGTQSGFRAVRLDDSDTLSSVHDVPADIGCRRRKVSQGALLDVFLHVVRNRDAQRYGQFIQRVRESYGYDAPEFFSIRLHNEFRNQNPNLGSLLKGYLQGVLMDDSAYAALYTTLRTLAKAFGADGRSEESQFLQDVNVRVCVYQAHLWEVPTDVSLQATQQAIQFKILGFMDAIGSRELDDAIITPRRRSALLSVLEMSCLQPSLALLRHLQQFETSDSMQAASGHIKGMIMSLSQDQPYDLSALLKWGEGPNAAPKGLNLDGLLKSIFNDLNVPECFRLGG